MLYFPFLGSPLSWDDRAMLGVSTFTHSLRNLPAAFTPERLAHGWDDRPAYRPLATATHFIDHVLWGHQAVGHRLPNLIAHVGATVLLFHLLRRLLARAGSSGDGPAFWGALLFGVHPAQSELVHCAVHRHAALGGLAVLATIWWHLESREGTGRVSALWKSLGALAAGLLSSETAMLAPLAIWAVAWAGDSWSPWRSEAGRARRAARAALPYAALVAVYVLARLLWLPPVTWALPEVDASRAAEIWAKLPVTFASVTTHLQLAAFPLDLSVEYVPPDALSWLDGRTLFAIWFLAAAGVAVVWTGSRVPLASAGLLWSTVALLGVQKWLPLTGLVEVAERHLDLVLAGAGVTLAAVLAKVQARLAVAGEASRVNRRDVLPWPALASALAVLTILSGALAVRTFMRGLDWRDPLRLYSATLARFPDAVQTRNRLGSFHLGRREFDEARVQYEQALARRPWDAGVLLNLGHTYAGLGKYDVAERVYKGVLHIDAGNATAYRMLSAVYDKMGRKEDAIRAYQVYLRLSGRAGGASPATAGAVPPQVP